MSRLLAYCAEAFSAIWRNRTRSILTMLGMIIGTSSIIAVLGISKAASGGITGTLNSFGDLGISVNVDFSQDNVGAAQIQYRDIRVIANALGPLLAHIEPAYQRNYDLRSGKTKVNAFLASDGDYHVDSLQMREGRRISTADVSGAAPVCDLSEQLSDHLFGEGTPAVGRILSVGPNRCTVIGVYAALKGGFFNSIGGNEFAVIPYTVYHHISPGPVDGINAYGGSGVTPGRAGDAIVAELKKIHGSRAQYIVQDQTAQVQSFNTVLGVIASGLTGIGGVALVVAGIGIMNIMLVSVTERTRDIGLRKSIGASRRDIATQFLLEAILLSLMGGGIGALLGFLLTLAAYSSVTALVGPAPIPYLLIISVAVGFSMIVGCVFGTYPALRASRLDPIAALRS